MGLSDWMRSTFREDAHDEKDQPACRHEYSGSDKEDAFRPLRAVAIEPHFRAVQDEQVRTLHQKGDSDGTERDGEYGHGVDWGTKRGRGGVCILLPVAQYTSNEPISFMGCYPTSICFGGTGCGRVEPLPAAVLSQVAEINCCVLATP
jgi:hypothetical protein